MAGIADTWEDWGSGPRTGFALGIAVIVAFAIATSLWLLRDEKQVLFSSLEARDAAAVVAELERLKIDYELAEGGEKILVPGSDVHETRLKLMGSGMPVSGGVGFELFDDSDFGMTEFAQRINFQRAMQGELARTIMAMREVKHARIHLVMPDGGLFRRDDERASAAVNLVMSGDTKLSADQVLGMQRLVAAAVQGLEPAMVTIIDQRGVTLSREVVEEGEAAAATARLARKQEVETYLTDKVMSVVEHSLGPGQAVVSIDVSLNMNQVRRTLENVVPEPGGEGVVKLKRESRNWGGDGEVNKDGAITTETQFDVSRQVEQIVEMPGSIARMSVGILVPDTLTTESLAKLQEVVTMAVGLNPARGDSIAVHAIAAADLERAGGGDRIVSPPMGPSPDVGDALPPLRAAAGTSEPMLGPLPLRIWLLAAAAALLLFIGIAVMQMLALRRARSDSGGRLSGAEREQVASQLRQWFDKEGAAAGGSAT